MSVKGRISTRRRSKHTLDCPAHVSGKLLSEAIPLLEVCPNKIDQVFGKLVRRSGALIGGKEVQTNVVFEHFGHETVDAATDVGQKHENVRAIIGCGERALDGVDLPANTFDANNQLQFFFVNMWPVFLDYILGVGYETKSGYVGKARLLRHVHCVRRRSCRDRVDSGHAAAIGHYQRASLRGNDPSISHYLSPTPAQ
jgi:hypothetical protein